MVKKVLILSYEEDPHARSVCHYFDQDGIDYFRVETDRLIENYNLTYDSESGLFVLKNQEREEVLDDSWNIWNRRVMDPTIPKGFPKKLEDIVYVETARTWEGLLFSHPGKVINRPQANFAANNKINQLKFAREYGREITIPQTILTNNPSVLKKFYAKHSKICHKLLKVALVEQEGAYKVVYNNLVTNENMAHADKITIHPSLFQTYIEKAYELRITVLEDKAVGIAIFSQDSKLSEIDFRRYDFDNVRYAKVDLPENVEKFCLDLTRNYGLSFGEIDMIVSPEGEYTFLEINPNGQWLWLELKSGYNLTEDIAKNLL